MSHTSLTQLRAKNKPSLAGDAASKSAFLRERWAIIKDIILRNENFTPPAIGGTDRSTYLKLSSTRQLLGRPNQLFLLFGILCRSPAGALCLEDPDGMVELDMEDAVPGEGLFTEGCMVLIEGEWTVEEKVRVLALGHPPSEKREVARSLHGHIDFLGGGAISIKEEQKYLPTVLANTQVSFVVLSDIWLDHPRVLSALQQMFEGYANTAEYRPMVFVLCGNFCQAGWQCDEGMDQYIRGFNGLTELLISIPLLHSSHFVFVPGPADPWSSPVLPRPAIPSALASQLISKIPNAQFVSNPCRIKYFGMEIVICRENLMGKMIRNLVVCKEGDGVDMKRYFVQTILDQTHLSPLPLTIRPTLWEFDHALRLYPMPSALVLADKYEKYELTYEGCHVFNPGKFVRGIGEDGWEFEWSMYYPATGKSERRRAEFTSQEEAAAKKASRSFRKYQYRGVELDNLLDLSNEDFINLVHARARRRFQRGLKRRPLGLIKKLRKAKTEAGANEKPAMVKTHLRDMIIVPEMIGSVVGVYNGKTFTTVEIKPEMTGHYLGEFSITYKPVGHSRGANMKDSRFVPLK
nr:DNA polymerase epsilon subunit B [Cryptococcus depauperatus CBS 7855]